MTDTEAGLTLARAAQSLVGSPFRLHGRDPESGLDCVGVLAIALCQAGHHTALPSDYRMRMRDISRFLKLAGSLGFEPADGSARPGDVMLFDLGACQYHFAIAVEHGAFVQAHAGVKRVILSPSLPDWTLAGHWRLAGSN